MVMRGESVIRPRPSKHRKERDRELARKAKEAMAKVAPMAESHQKKN